jgi:hypothetical protein
MTGDSVPPIQTQKIPIVDLNPPNLKNNKHKERFFGLTRVSDFTRQNIRTNKNVTLPLGTNEFLK